MADIEIPESGLIEEAPPVEQEAPKPRNPREEAMARIAARYEEQQRAGELEYGETLQREAAERARAVAPVEEAPALEAPVSDEPEADQAQEGAASAKPATAQPKQEAAPSPLPTHAEPVGPTLHTVVVQGQPLQVTTEQLHHLASIGAVANAAMQRYQAAPQAAPEPRQEPVARQPVLDKDRAAAIVQRLSYGSPEDGASALQELADSLAARQAPQVDAAAIRQSAVQETLQHIQLNNDLATIGHEFPSIWASRALSVGAAAELQEIRQRDMMLGVRRPNLEQYREACKAVLGQLPQTAMSQSAGESDNQPASQAAVQVATTRLERKRAAPRQPAGVSRAASLGEDMPRAPSASQIVDAIRRQRGQMPMN